MNLQEKTAGKAELVFEKLSKYTKDDVTDTISGGIAGAAVGTAIGSQKAFEKIVIPRILDTTYGLGKPGIHSATKRLFRRSKALNLASTKAIKVTAITASKGAIVGAGIMAGIKTYMKRKKD